MRKGFETQVSYRPNGDIIEKIDPLGEVTRSFYDHRSRVIEEVNKKGESTRYEYDGNDNVVRSIDPLGREYQVFYDGEDRVIREVGYSGREVVYEYDANGRRKSVTGPSGRTTSFEYDLVGNQTAIIDYKGEVAQRIEYNQFNQPKSVTDIYGNILVFRYDSLGRQTEVVNPAGKSLNFEYDDLDRLVKVTDPMGREFTREYHSDDMVRRISGPNSNYANFSYDSANRLTNIGNFFSSPVSDSYDGRGLLTRDNLPSGNRLIMEYDEVGRLIELGETDDSFPIVPFRVVGYEYDINGNIVKVGELTESGGTFTSNSSRTYDELDRITSYQNEKGETIAYTYNVNGELIRVTYPDGKAVQYAYDDEGRLERVTDWASRETAYAYDDDGQIASIAFPNGATRVMEYDEGGRIVHRLDLDSSGGTIVEYRYSYDALNNLMVQSVGHNVEPYQPTNVSMTYNTGNRLSSYNGAPVTIDVSGNMTSGPLNGGTATYDYDVRGNLVSAGNVDYSYDFEDRLSGWTDESGTTAFTINPSAGLSQILVKTDPDDSVTRYVYGVGLLYEETSDGLRVFHYDERGNTVALSGDAGTVVGELSYGPYGEVYRRIGSTDTMFKFGGLFGVITDDQGLCYMRFRWYSSEIKRFISQDAHIGDIAGIGTLNRYAYAGGNPISRVDPEGEFWNVVIGATVGAAVSVTVELATDLLDGNGIDKGWQDYAGAAIGGAITGGILGACPTCAVGAEVAGAAASNLFKVAFDPDKDFSAGSLVSDVALAAAFGKFSPGTKGSGALSRRINYGSGKANFTTVSSRVSMDVDRGIAVFTLKSTPNATTRIASSLRSDAKEYGAALATDVFSGTVQSALQGGISDAISPSVDAALEQAGGFILSNISNMFNDSRILLPYNRGGGNPTSYGNLNVMNRARGEILRGQQGVYGEFTHWRLYTGVLGLAQEPIPQETGRQLTTF